MDSNVHMISVYLKIDSDISEKSICSKISSELSFHDLIKSQLVTMLYKGDRK